MPRKSRVSPPSTPNRCQVLPSSSDFRITPFEPEAQTTGTGTPFSPGALVMLTLRRLVSMPLVCTFHHCASAGTAKKSKSNKTGKEKTLGFIARSFTLPRCQIHDDFSAFHDENNAAYGGDVFERVAIESDDVGVEAGRDGAGAILDTEGFGRERVGGNHRSHGVLATGLHAIEEFLGIAAVSAGDCVGAEDHF